MEEATKQQLAASPRSGLARRHRLAPARAPIAARLGGERCGGTRACTPRGSRATPPNGSGAGDKEGGRRSRAYLETGSTTVRWSPARTARGGCFAGWRGRRVRPCGRVVVSGRAGLPPRRNKSLSHVWGKRTRKGMWVMRRWNLIETPVACAPPTREGRKEGAGFGFGLGAVAGDGGRGGPGQGTKRKRSGLARFWASGQGKSVSCWGKKLWAFLATLLAVRELSSLLLLLFCCSLPVDRLAAALLCCSLPLFRLQFHFEPFGLGVRKFTRAGMLLFSRIHTIAYHFINR